MTTITFRPQSVSDKLIKVLPERAQDVIVSRFGLKDDVIDGMTLEAIGNKYGITRERVRQIENHSLNKIKKSEIIGEQGHVFSELMDLMHDMGVIVPEDEFLSHVSEDRKIQNHIYLFLVLGDEFTREKENKHFKHRWHVNETLADKVKQALQNLHDSLTEDDLVPEEHIIETFLTHLDTEPVPDQHLSNQNVIKRWIALSKKVDSNPLGEWGLTSSPNVRVKGMRDYAYLVLRRHGNPMHFREVTEAIKKLFDKEAHVATTHNELIKDDRFVLVGRGLYALKEWGYMEGVVRDVIRQILEDQGPLTREEVVEKVLKERYVKENTVIVNLQNNDEFKRNDNGLYIVTS